MSVRYLFEIFFENFENSSHVCGGVVFLMIVEYHQPYCGMVQESIPSSSSSSRFLTLFDVWCEVSF